MAANKFASLLHRRTNKLTLVLVYAFLEWVLIFFLLLNSLFSYFIIKFADFFGLQKPCLWCCRLDHVFEPSKFHNSHRSLICEAHSLEISKLGYCSNHRKLAESRDMCVDCKSSGEISKKFVFFPMMNKLGVNTALISKCSCCGVSLEKTPFSPNGFLTKPLWGEFKDSPKVNLILEGEIDEHIGEKQGNYDENRNREGKTEENFSYSVSSLDCIEMAADLVVEKEGESAKKDNVSLHKDEVVRDETREMSCEMETRHLEFYVDQDACHLIPIETEESTQKLGTNEMEGEDFVMEFDDKNVRTQYDLVLKDRRNSEKKLPLLPILECEEEALIAELEAIELNKIEENLADFEIELFPIESLQSVEGEMKSHVYQVDTSEPEINETSTDGSITSDIEGDETVEELKMALKAERKALNEVYAELEEERSCSAEAANQAMAMINKLQQEKAAIQMEALQYQRIMEEQSEYDHEALQMINELMVEKENELEFYRKKVQDYETREKLEISKHKTPFDGYEVNGKQGKRLNGVNPKRLVPLFDAILGETEEELAINKNEVETIEKVYERLQQLEEDAEFVRHCSASLNKGDKGILLLQEVLQHLRDLRCVETRARTSENGFAHS